MCCLGFQPSILFGVLYDSFIASFLSNQIAARRAEVSVSYLFSHRGQQVPFLVQDTMDMCSGKGILTIGVD